MKLTLSALTVAATAALLAAPGLAHAAPGDLFEGNGGNGTILKITPGGTQSTFATGLSNPRGLAFDAAGNLFEADSGSGLIFKIAPDGTRTPFATGLNLPRGLAFDAAGNLFEADSGTNTIFKFAPGGSKTTFATVNGPYGLAFQPIPEPGTYALILGGLGLLGLGQRFRRTAARRA